MLAKDPKNIKEVLRYYATRLTDTLKIMADSKDLKEMAKDAARKDIPTYVAETIKVCHEALGGLDDANNPALATLQNWAMEHPAPHQVLYKGLADSALGAPAAAPPTSELKTQEPPKPPER